MNFIKKNTTEENFNRIIKIGRKKKPYKRIEHKKKKKTPVQLHLRFVHVPSGKTKLQYKGEGTLEAQAKRYFFSPETNVVATVLN